MTTEESKRTHGECPQACPRSWAIYPEGDRPALWVCDVPGHWEAA